MRFWCSHYSIGVVAGLRALTAPAVVSWAAFLGWVDLDNRWLHWLGHPATVTVLTILAVVELVTDQLPKTPSRKTPPQFITRIIMGGFAGAVLGAASHYTWSSLGAGVVGAVLGTLGGYELRSRLVAATGGRDLPIALLEDVIAVGGGFLIVYYFGAPVTRRFDAIIIGAGQAGPPLAGRLTDAGQTVAVLERKHDRRYLRQHRVHPDQDPGGQRPHCADWRVAGQSMASAPDPSGSTWPRSRHARTASC